MSSFEVFLVAAMLTFSFVVMVYYSVMNLLEHSRQYRSKKSIFNLMPFILAFVVTAVFEFIYLVVIMVDKPVINVQLYYAYRISAGLMANAFLVNITLASYNGVIKSCAWTFNLINKMLHRGNV